jgi:hypothetical protein
VVSKEGSTIYAYKDDGTQTSGTEAATVIQNCLTAIKNAGGGLLTLKRGTYSITLAGLGANIGLKVPSNTKIFLQPGTIITQPAGEYLGTNNNGIFINDDTITNGNENIEISGGKFIGTQPNAANTQFTKAIRFNGVSNLWIHDVVFDGCAVSTSDFGSTTIQPILGKATNITCSRLVFQNSCPAGLTAFNAAGLTYENIVCPANGCIDDIIAIHNAGERITIRECYLNKSLSDGVHGSAGHPIDIQGNAGAFGLVDLNIESNTLLNAPSTNPSLLVANFAITRHVNIRDNLCEGSNAGIKVTGNTGPDAHFVIDSNTIRNNRSVGIHCEMSVRLDGLWVINNDIFDNNTSAGGNPYAIRFIGGIAPAFRRVHIKNNNMYDSGGGTQTTQIRFEGGSAFDTFLEISGNSFTGTAFSSLPSGSYVFVHNNQGFTTEAKGTGTINSGTTSATITHGLSYTPTLAEVSIIWGENPTNTVGTWWVSGITSTQFVLNVENDPGASNIDFGWSVCRI